MLGKNQNPTGEEASTEDKFLWGEHIDIRMDGPAMKSSFDVSSEIPQFEIDDDFLLKKDSSDD
jgi:hypothetical protein